jgi:uncharacterized protein with NRDE domain
MCTVVVLRRPGHPWPLILAANRDEMMTRAWSPPGRHWPDRGHVIAGRDIEAGGTWMALCDDGVAAAILNRRGSLGPAAGKRSRGELPLEAVDHAEARVAAQALAQIEPTSFRSFNLVVADARSAHWIRSDGESVEKHPIPDGLSMITAGELNDIATSERVRHHLPRFRAAPVPDPGADDWFGWEALMASEEREAGADSGGAMNISTDYGFGTVSSSLLALPDPTLAGVRPVWKFCPGRPGSQPYAAVDLG